jgi:hypothetical protein
MQKMKTCYNTSSHSDVTGRRSLYKNSLLGSGATHRLHRHVGMILKNISGTIRHYRLRDCILPNCCYQSLRFNKASLLYAKHAHLIIAYRQMFKQFLTTKHKRQTSPWIIPDYTCQQSTRLEVSPRPAAAGWGLGVSTRIRRESSESQTSCRGRGGG